MRYNLDFKLKVISYYWQGHTGVATAKKFGLDKKIISRWINQYKSGGIEAIKPKASKTKYSSKFKLNVLTVMLEQGLASLRSL